MRGITFCLVCGGEAPLGSRACPSCGAPLRHDRAPLPRRGGRWPEVSPLTVLCVLAAVALVVAIVTALVV